MAERYHKYEFELGDSGFYAAECLECGSLVINKVNHDEFHESLRKFSASLKTTRNLAAQAHLVSEKLQHHGH